LTSLGERSLAIAREYLARGVTEAEDGDQVLAILYACRRGGGATAGILDASGIRMQLTLDDAWCAAFASFCLALAIDGTDPADRAACPHGYRCSVRELVEDAKRLRTWRGPTERPELGWLAIWPRGGQNPLRGGTGHVGRVSWIGDATFEAIEGNTTDRVGQVMHTFADDRLLGWIVT
jgi:hypothetical protein